MNTPSANPSPPVSTKERAGERAIALAYLFFFAIWLIGYCLGLADNTALLWGFPLWFSLSCLISFGAILIVLFHIARRFFQ